jgi:hypothetical protein
MFYLLKDLLLLIMVIFKLKCNNLIFNEIMVLNASYVCLHVFSLHRESPDPDPGRRTLISEVVMSQKHSWQLPLSINCLVYIEILVRRRKNMEKPICIS